MRVSEDNDYVEDEEPVSDVDLESKRRKRLVGSNREMAVTTHLQTGKDTSSGNGKIKGKLREGKFLPLHAVVRDCSALILSTHGYYVITNS